MGQLEGKVAFITGGGKGIGKEIANMFAKEKAKVTVVDMDEKSLKEMKSECLEKGVEIDTYVVDVTNREQIRTSMKQTVEAHGSLDILVNNAGVIRDNLLFKLSDDDWETIMDIHLKGAFYCSQEAQKYMVEKGYGRIINLSSTSALGNRGQANYATAKAGIQGFTKTLAIELGPYGITTNAIAPGFIETDMTKATAERMGVSFEKFLDEVKKNVPARRPGKPADIANAALFFALEASSYVNGQILYVAGGPRV